ncbi:MAG: ankyrin repeat domain-containing protein [Planctomycetota bacterium]|jgi:ribosome biogenesis protein Nip4
MNSKSIFILSLVLLVFISHSEIFSQGLTSNEQKLLEAAKSGSAETVKSLLKEGTKANIKDANGHTPLHLASANGHKLTAQVLVEYSADINVKDKEGKTPLDLAKTGGHSGMVQFLLDKGPRILKPSLKFKTIEQFEKEIGEPAILLESENVCFFVPERREQEARIVFGYLVKAYNELYRIVGIHTEYKIAVYAFDKGNPHGWGGTTNCSIEYDESNLEFENQQGWIQYKIPHVSGYIEEMAHSFVHASKAQFGWEMIGWSLGVRVTNKIARNPISSKQIIETRKKQKETFRRYVKNEFVFPDDIEANKCDRIHAWILRECEFKYGPAFWNDFFKELRDKREELKEAGKLGQANKVRNARYQITIDCFDHLPGVNFKGILRKYKISLTTDVKSLNPMEPSWDRRFIM